jgi:hypothetical protein
MSVEIREFLDRLKALELQAARCGYVIPPQLPEPAERTKKDVASRFDLEVRLTQLEAWTKKRAGETATMRARFSQLEQWLCEPKAGGGQ